jgi:hypothetical protein
VYSAPSGAIEVPLPVNKKRIVPCFNEPEKKSGSETMRCTSSESLVTRLEEATIGAPIEMLGTKWLLNRFF